MAAAVLWRQGRGLTRFWITGFYCRSTSFYSSPATLKQKLLHLLYTRFYDMETIINWSVQLRQWNLRRKNAYYGYTEKLYGHHVAAAFFVLSRKGGVRFQGQETWFRADKRGKFSWDFLDLRGVPVEAVDASGLLLNYIGLDNIVTLKELKELNLSRCPHIDDWCLSRVYLLQDSLEVLSLAGCPQVTERGLATLHHLHNLKQLDVSHLPSVANKGLVAILLEEMLPHCTIVGLDYGDGLAMDHQLESKAEGPEGALKN
ncbi:distal membrane-arm assembly complex protein 2 isoform X2 [Rhinatrema bivittatum]|uniref:distal membrane-arm assembly complex protein 2 isoform X2 n=1 Tax=Rhinatrema bivittatum TaxID=194408 RepID=UPI00112A6E65|nr:distal membrane-arm assembly complex protein 2 isoform X2 [Rhinatrema bivittatum]